jgi:hypothetical protein
MATFGRVLSPQEQSLAASEQNLLPPTDAFFRDQQQRKFFLDLSWNLAPTNRQLCVQFLVKLDSIDDVQ